MSPMVELVSHYVLKEPGKNDKEIYCVIVNNVSCKKAPQKIWHKPQVKSYSHCFPRDTDILWVDRFGTIQSFVVTQLHFPENFVFLIKSEEV